MSAQPWITRSDGSKHCTRHDRVFELPLACPECTADPGDPIDDEIDEEVAAPRGCQNPDAHERELTSIAKFAMRTARELERKGESRITQNTAVKWGDLAVKARRAAAELAQRRADEELVRRREKRIRDRNRGGSH